MKNEIKQPPYYPMSRTDFLQSNAIPKQINPHYPAPNDEAFVMCMTKHTREDGAVWEYPMLQVFDQIFTTNKYKIIKKLRNSTAEYAKGLNIGDVIEFHIYLNEVHKHPSIDMIKNGKIFKKVYNNEIHKLFNEDNPIYQIKKI